MNIEYDPRAKAVYIRVQEGDVARTKSLDGNVNVDYRSDGKVLGIEVLTVEDLNIATVRGESETTQPDQSREPKTLAQAIVDWLVEWRLLRDRQQTERYLHDGD